MVVFGVKYADGPELALGAGWRLKAGRRGGFPKRGTRGWVGQVPPTAAVMWPIALVEGASPL